MAYPFVSRRPMLTGFRLGQIGRPVRRNGAFRRVSTGAGFLRVSRGFQLSFLRECPIIERSRSFGSLW